MSAAISHERKNSSTDTTVVGTLDEVFEAIKRLFTEYHPYGYGTSVSAIRHAGSDLYEARINRANSCD